MSRRSGPLSTIAAALSAKTGSRFFARGTTICLTGPDAIELLTYLDSSVEVRGFPRSSWSGGQVTNYGSRSV